MSLLANISLTVTDPSKFFRSVQLDPAANLGIVKVGSDGVGYHTLWGLTSKAVPTFELLAHFLSYCERIKTINGKDRVIMHCHATNPIALIYVLENNTAVFTRQLWESSTECLVVSPDGVGILPWMAPGTDEIGQVTTQEMQRHSLVLWPFHSVFGSKPTLGETSGLTDITKKLVQALVKVYSMDGMKQIISRRELITLDQHFDVTPLTSVLTPQGTNMIRKTFVMQVNPDVHEGYQCRYNPIWPGLETVSRSHGAYNYVIYLDKACNLLLATVEIEPEERRNAVTNTDIRQRWWKYMTDVMPTSANNNPVSSELQEVPYLP